jgi:hypothetical protein
MHQSWKLAVVPLLASVSALDRLWIQQRTCSACERATLAVEFRYVGR